MHAIHQEREFLMDFFYNYYFGNTMSTNTLINSYNTIETKLIKIKELADKVWEHPYIKDNNIYQILAWADEKYPLIKWLKKKPTTSEEDAILHYLRT